MSVRQSASEREGKEFSLGDGWVKSTSVFACLPHIKETFKLICLSYTSKDKHSLYCADISLSPCFSFSLPLRALEDCIQTPRNKPGGPQTTHSAGSHSSFHQLLLSQPTFWDFATPHFNLYRLLRFLLFFCFLVPYVSAQLAEFCMPTLPCFHLHSSSVFHFVCLNILM